MALVVQGVPEGPEVLGVQGACVMAVEERRVSVKGPCQVQGVHSLKGLHGAEGGISGQEGGLL